ncbi:MAG: hypothetical protein JXN60_05180 [Lentisphaerae bacterium]|nr:hypothetical protein [Lentisphaerota bacterium]
MTKRSDRSLEKAGFVVSRLEDGIAVAISVAMIAAVFSLATVWKCGHTSFPSGINDNAKVALSLINEDIRNAEIVRAAPSDTDMTIGVQTASGVVDVRYYIKSGVLHRVISDCDEILASGLDQLSFRIMEKSSQTTGDGKPFTIFTMIGYSQPRLTVLAVSQDISKSKAEQETKTDVKTLWII